MLPLLRSISPMLFRNPNYAVGEFNVPANNTSTGIGTYDLGNDDDKIDYLLLSPALFGRVSAAGLFRKGAWPGKRPGTVGGLP
jgi:hypothetical protein